MKTSAFNFTGFQFHPPYLPIFLLRSWFYHRENVPQWPCWGSLPQGRFFSQRDGVLFISPGSLLHPRALRLQTTNFSSTLFLASEPQDWDLAQIGLIPSSLVFWYFLEGAERSAYSYYPPGFGVGLLCAWLLFFSLKGKDSSNISSPIFLYKDAVLRWASLISSILCLPSYLKIWLDLQISQRKQRHVFKAGDLLFEPASIYKA